MAVGLTFTQTGGGPPVLLLHGLFGASGNWGGIARRLSATHRVIAADLRGHGASPHVAPLDYPAMASDVADLIEREGIGPAAVVGHSMGGKVAMWLALTHPALVSRLAVVDIAPVRYPGGLIVHTKAMAAIPLREGLRRAEADAALRDAVADPAIRAFLLQNLRFGEGAPAWRCDLAGISAALETLSGFPVPPPPARYDGAVMVLRGEHSDYVTPDRFDAVLALLPSAAFVTIPGAGHWVHAEAPDAFLAALEPFLAIDI